MKETLIALADNFGGFIIGGLIGAIIQRIRIVMSLKEFLGVLVNNRLLVFILIILLSFNSFSQENTCINKEETKNTINKCLVKRVKKKVLYKPKPLQVKEYKGFKDTILIIIVKDTLYSTRNKIYEL